MKNIRLRGTVLIAAALAVAFFAGFAAGKTRGADVGADTGGIPFEYFYRGFTPVTDAPDVSAFEAASGVKLILTDAEWTDFGQKFCPTALAFAAPDFTKECLIAVGGLYGSRASENVSSDIKNITCEAGLFDITYDDGNQPERIYALNTGGGGHWFVNVLAVDKSDLPPDVTGG
ncbi:MAG: hypothetical protein LBS90_00380 [Oscillospiraceae bacterium]|jgi:hypothetical protein|nr:hypothetical protein [Oscillospiraceae bacterium]